MSSVYLKGNAHGGEFSHVYFISLASSPHSQKNSKFTCRVTFSPRIVVMTGNSPYLDGGSLPPLLPDRESQVPSIDIPHKFPLQ